MIPATPELSNGTLRMFRSSLLAWYDASRRDLPWRETRDPYRIWVSEIMLQQTRVAAVLDFYRRFLDRFPNVATLAKAEEAEVLAVWSGLGYYRRARAMHKAAQTIMAEFQGTFPRTPKELQLLPGVGRYTAAAISSIAFGSSASVVDGNVERVLSRVLGKELTSNKLWAAAEKLLDSRRPGDWNQAMMELGATVCLPAEPKCLVCPLNRWCQAPGRELRKPQARRTLRELGLGLARKRGTVYLVRRSASESLMPNMWELPAVEKQDGSLVLYRAKHSITNSDYSVSVLELHERDAQGGKWFSCSKLPELPVTGLTRKILRAANLWPKA